MTFAVATYKSGNSNSDNQSRFGLVNFFVCVFMLFSASMVNSQSTTELPAACDTIIDDATGQIEEIKIVCQPDEWNGILVVYAQGYIPPAKDIQVSNGTRRALQILLPGLLSNGFALATTSFKKNGYAHEQAEKDIHALVDNYPGGEPETVLLVGASEGALVITGLLEKNSKRYDGGLALCGPLAGINYTVKYFGDFRVIFDYLFPVHPADDKPVFFTDPDDPVGSTFGVIPPNKGDLFWEDNWLSGINYKRRIQDTILDDLTNNDGKRTRQLFDVVRVAMPDENDPEYSLRIMETVSAILSYDIRGFNDLGATAGGDPYGNRHAWYWGSDNDRLLNARVERVSPSRRARAYLRKYYTPRGKLKVPLVSIHTLRDGFVPFRNQFIYELKTLIRGSADKFHSIPVDRFGHCVFEPEEALGAFGLLLSEVGIPTSNELEINRSLLPEAH